MAHTIEEGNMIRNVIALLAGFSIALGGLMITIGVHDEPQPEDGTTIWICSISGDGECGPNTPPIQVAPANILYNWDLVF